MEEKIKKLKLLAATDSKRFLELLRDIIQEWKSLDKVEKNKFREEIKNLEKIGNEIFMTILTKKAEYHESVIYAIEKGSKGLFDISGLKTNIIQVRRMLNYMLEDKPQEALKTFKKISSSATYRAETLLNTLTIANSRANVVENAKKRGIKQFRYEGPRGALSRDFCRARVGKVYTIDEIEKMDNGQNLPVLYFCGGYNCRHRWVAVEETLKK